MNGKTQNQIEQTEISKYSNAETNNASVKNLKLNEKEELRRMQLIFNELKCTPIYYS